jgi:hypothetical protein
MKLATKNPQLKEAPANTSVLYRTARNYLNIVDEITPVSIHVFQSLVLVALYEIGQGIFSAAYLMVGRGARLGILMGVHDRKVHDRKNTTQLSRLLTMQTHPLHNAITMRASR